jgi:hypothetical protein
LLIDRYVAQKEALEKGDHLRAKRIELEIKELHREKEEVRGWASTPSA